MTFTNQPEKAIYVSGDTVWYSGVAEVAQRFKVRVTVLFMGAARVPEVGQDHLTMTAQEGVQAALAFSSAIIVPLHYEGWAHFSESREQINHAFVREGIENRVYWIDPGSTAILTL